MEDGAQRRGLRRAGPRDVRWADGEGWRSEKSGRGGTGNDDNDDDGSMSRRRTTVLHYHADIQEVHLTLQSTWHKEALSDYDIVGNA